MRFSVHAGGRPTESSTGAISIADQRGVGMITGPIALVAHRYAPAIGGVERVVEQLALGLARRGIAVEGITTDPTPQLPIPEQRDGVLGRPFPTLGNDSPY